MVSPLLFPIFTWYLWSCSTAICWFQSHYTPMPFLSFVLSNHSNAIKMAFISTDVTLGDWCSSDDHSFTHNGSCSSCYQMCLCSFEQSLSSFILYQNTLFVVLFKFHWELLAMSLVCRYNLPGLAAIHFLRRLSNILSSIGVLLVSSLSTCPSILEQGSKSLNVPTGWTAHVAALIGLGQDSVPLISI